jgi:TRAP-type C4-dicarboxylate transport system permease small subunit
MRALARAYDALIAGLVAAAAATMAAVAGLIVWDVVARNLGMRPPDSTVALTEYAMLYVTMAVAPALVRSRGHVVIEALHQRLPAGVRRPLDRAILAFCALVSLAVALLAALLAAEASGRGEIDVRSFDLPRAALFLPLVAGFGLMATEFLRLLARGENLMRPPAERGSL